MSISSPVNSSRRTTGTANRQRNCQPKQAETVRVSVKKQKINEIQKREDAIADKRRKATERKRKQRQRIAMDPEAQQIYRAKERALYKKRKEEGKVKSIHDLNKVKQARKRKMWRFNSKRYYERKLQAKQKQQADETSNTLCNEIMSHQQESGKKRAKANRRKLYNKCSRLARKLQQSKVLVER